MTLSRTAGALLCAALFTTSLSAGNMREGQWQITLKMEMAGAPIKIPPMTVDQCITKKDLNDPQKTLPQARKDCKVSNYKVEGNTVSWNVQCDSQKTTGSGKLIFESDSSYKGAIDMDMAGQKAHMDMTGKRTGDCK